MMSAAAATKASEAQAVTVREMEVVTGVTVREMAWIKMAAATLSVVAMGLEVVATVMEVMARGARAAEMKATVEWAVARMAED